MKNIFDPAKKRLVKLNIELLKKRLADSDYKVIKYAECSLAGEDAPYDITALHAERQIIRDKINALETALAALEAEEV